MTTFEDAKIGDRVWSLEFGWGEVVSRDICSKCFTAEFNNEFETYCFKGTRKRPLREKMQTLFWDEVVIKAPAKPMPALKVDTKVLVWDNGSEHGYEHRVKRHFSHFENGELHTFDLGHTSWTGGPTTGWDHWEIAE